MILLGAANLVLTHLSAENTAGVSSESENLTAFKVKSPPRIDGKLDDEAWSCAPSVTCFKINGSGAPSAFRTEGKILYDDKFLYIGFRCGEPNIASIVRNPSSRDSEAIYRNDCVEVMLDPGQSQSEYFHFIIDVNGNVFDRSVSQGGVIGDNNWNADILSASHVGPDFWSCEIRIPYYSLSLTPKAQKTWGVNLCRGKRAPLENSSAAKNGSFNRAPDFLALNALDTDFSKFFVNIADPVAEAKLASNMISAELSIPISNLDSKQHEAILTAAFLPPNGDVIGVSQTVTILAAGARTVVADNFHLPGNGNYPVRITWSDPETKETLAIRGTKVSINYSPLELKLLKPAYRNSIYSSQNIREVSLLAATPMEKTELDDAILTVSTLAEGAEKPVSVRTVKPVQSSNLLSLDISALPYGKFVFSAKVSSSGGLILAAATLSALKVPPSADEWTVDENQLLRHNGQPFWAYGWYGGSFLANGKYNVNFEYGQAFLSVEQIRPQVEKLLKNNVFSIVEPWPKELYRVNFTKELTRDDENMLRKRIQGLRGIPGLMGYYLEDEPDGHSALPRRYERAREIIMEEDPYHPCFMLCADASRCATYMNTCDIMMIDPYFRPMRNMPSAMPLNFLSSQLAAAKASMREKPVWVVPQAFDFWEIYPDSRCPNFLELRNQWLQAVIGGAKGIMWFVARTKNFDFDTDIGERFISCENASLLKALCSPVSDCKIECLAPHPKELLTGMSETSKMFYVFAVNTAPAVLKDVRVSLPVKYDGNLWVVSENRRLRVDKGVFCDDFAPYAGHIYTNDPAILNEKIKTLAEIESEITKAKESAKGNPDNLACFDLGVKVKCSNDQDWYPLYPPYVLINGGHENTEAGVGGAMPNSRIPKRIELSFPAPARIGHLILHGNLGKYEIETQMPDKSWKTIPSKADRVNDKILSVEFTPEVISAIAIKIYSAMEGQRLWISKIEAFEK